MTPDFQICLFPHPHPSKVTSKLKGDLEAERQKLGTETWPFIIRREFCLVPWGKRNHKALVS